VHDKPPEWPDLSPPIAFVDEGGGIGPLFRSVDDLIVYLEWPDQFQDEEAEAYDASGRHLTLTVEHDGRVVLSIDRLSDRERFESLLRSVARDRPFRFGLLDADVEVDTLLRALWPHMRWGKGSYPGK
jgi:hypothetical protein